MVVSNRNLLFQRSIFRCYVSFREGTILNIDLLGFYQPFYERNCNVRWVQSTSINATLHSNDRDLLVAYIGMAVRAKKRWICLQIRCFGLSNLRNSTSVRVLVWPNEIWCIFAPGTTAGFEWPENSPVSSPM